MFVEQSLQQQQHQYDNKNRKYQKTGSKFNIINTVRVIYSQQLHQSQIENYKANKVGYFQIIVFTHLHLPTNLRIGVETIAIARLIFLRVSSVPLDNLLHGFLVVHKYDATSLHGLS